MYRFTIRDVLWLMVVVGLGVGWWLNHRQAAMSRLRVEQLTNVVDRHVELLSKIKTELNNQDRELLIFPNSFVAIRERNLDWPPAGK